MLQRRAAKRRIEPYWHSGDDLLVRAKTTGGGGHPEGLEGRWMSCPRSVTSSPNAIEPLSRAVPCGRGAGFTFPIEGVRCLSPGQIFNK